ncbi:ABC transporter substrate-binding protein [Comamonas serinivorans]|uniref:ABC transporter substrate-binding protein n=1 Tax=Comamonas serinivorans TaxID=1082851 RepID=A0A1Y0ELW3_9BURK|nr:tripartite tricarboxylate transporter substrate binding protein [Comamonas serinivorans]ARU04390.1 ABC transporter substrate-binding protein [Comamonas serinivorans]
MQRRHFALMLAASAALASGVAMAKDYPDSPVTIIVPYAAGGVSDIMGRALGQALSKQLGQSVIIENKPGAAGAMGVLDIKRARPDGYRLTLTPAGIFRQPHVQKVQYDPVKDVRYIATFMTYDFVITVPPDSPFKTVKELVDYAKAHPGEITYGTPGNYTGNHIAMAALEKATGAQFTHVPFKGDSETINAVLGKQIKVGVFANSAHTYIQSGKLRALATTADKRPPAFGTIPTLRESGYPIDIPSPNGLAGPKGLPDAIVTKLQNAVKAAMDDPDFQKQLTMNAVRPYYLDSAAYTKFAAEMFKREGEIVKGLTLN